MLGFFEGGVLRHNEPPDQPADEPRFVPVIEVIFIRQPHGAVFGVQLDVYKRQEAPQRRAGQIEQNLRHAVGGQLGNRAEHDAVHGRGHERVN